MFTTMTLGKDIREEEIPEDMKEKAEEYHELICWKRLLRPDEELMEKYLEGEELQPSPKLKRLFVQAQFANEIVPVLCGTSYKNKGVQKLLDAIVDYMPAPTDVAAIKRNQILPQAKKWKARLLTTLRLPLWHLKLWQTPLLVSCASSAYIPVRWMPVPTFYNSTKDVNGTNWPYSADACKPQKGY